MAAVRLGVFGWGDKQSRITLYSSVPLRSIHSGEEEISKCASGSRYGVPLLSDKTAQQRYCQRRRMIDKRICDWSVYAAMFGLLLAIAEVEISAGWREFFALSFIIRLAIILSTVILDILIVLYHWAEIEIISADTGHKFLTMTSKRRLKLFIELLICSCCPFLWNFEVNWPSLGERSALLGQRAQIPLNVLLTIPMFLRLYILCRCMVLHSALIQDAATRTIASFNQRPLTFVFVVSLTFWSASSWLLTQCERYTKDLTKPTSYYLADYMWFEAVTFFAVGYGDLKVETYCGRGIAILTGIVVCFRLFHHNLFKGTVFSSLITVLLSQRMLLTLAERRVNQVVAESQLSKQHKNAAARVLQNLWRVVRWQNRLVEFSTPSKKLMLHLRLAQRNLLQSILEFRRCRWKLRLRMEEEDDIITVTRAFSETEDRLKTLRARQQQLGYHLQTLGANVDHLSLIFHPEYNVTV